MKKTDPDGPDGFDGLADRRETLAEARRALESVQNDDRVPPWVAWIALGGVGLIAVILLVVALRSILGM